MASGVANGSNTANRIIASILLTEENILLTTEENKEISVLKHLSDTYM